MREEGFRDDRMYRPTEIVANGHVPRDLVYSALHAGDLKSLRRGSRYLVPGSCVLEWMRQVAS